MYDYNEHIIKNNNNPPKIGKKFLDALSEFICSVESEMDNNVTWICILTIPVVLQSN